MDTKDINELFIFRRSCEKCDHQWFPRASSPQRCPRCQTWLDKPSSKGAPKVNEVPAGKFQ